jgi:CxxC motif-containing protein
MINLDGKNKVMSIFRDQYGLGVTIELTVPVKKGDIVSTNLLKTIKYIVAMQSGNIGDTIPFRTQGFVEV